MTDHNWKRIQLQCKDTLPSVGETVAFYAEEEGLFFGYILAHPDKAGRTQYYYRPILSGIVRSTISVKGKKIWWQAAPEVPCNAKSRHKEDPSMKDKNLNRQGFLNHVDSMKHMEADKDTFLKAARLERHESKREPLKPRHIVAMVAAICAMFMFCAILVGGYLAGDFAFGVMMAIAFIICAVFSALRLSTI